MALYISDGNGNLTKIAGNFAESEFLEITKTSDQNFGSTSQVKITGFTTVASRGTRLTLSNNAITIGSGVSYIKISGKARLERKTSGTTRFNIDTYKNGSSISSPTYYCAASGDCDYLGRYVLTFVAIVPVTSGDVISFYAQSTANGSTSDVIQKTTTFVVEVV